MEFKNGEFQFGFLRFAKNREVLVKMVRVGCVQIEIKIKENNKRTP